MAEIPAEIWAAVKDNIVVQWFLVVVVVLLVGTSTAEKVKGPLGAFARWARSFGAARDERESKERQRARERSRDLWASEKEDWIRRLNDVESQLADEQQGREELRNLITTHLAWDYDRVEQLIGMGVEPATIPAAPPLRVRVAPNVVQVEPSIPQRRLGPDDRPKLT